MKTIQLTILCAITLVIASCKSDVKPVNSLKNSQDSVSYALGMDVAFKSKTVFEGTKRDPFIQGYIDGLDSTRLLLDPKQIDKIISDYTKKIRKEQRIRKDAQLLKERLVKFADYKKSGEEFLKKNASKKGVVTTESGLQYMILKEGKGKKPTDLSIVDVHYQGSLFDGTVFETTYNTKKAKRYGVSQVAKGWTEGLQLMNEGAKFRFFLPNELAYGSSYPIEKIKPFSVLVLDVELVKIVK